MGFQHGCGMAHLPVLVLTPMQCWEEDGQEVDTNGKQANQNRLTGLPDDQWSIMSEQAIRTEKNHLIPKVFCE